MFSRESKDLAERIAKYEEGTLTEEATVELFQHLVDTGLAWRLQGHYGRTAQALLDARMLNYPRKQ